MELRESDDGRASGRTRGAIPRRAILVGAGIGAFAAVTRLAVDAVPARADAVITLEADGIRVECDAAGALTVSDGVSTRLVLQHVLVKDSVFGQQRSYGGSPSAVTLDDGRDGIRVAYTMAAAAASVTVVGTFAVRAACLDASWTLEGDDTLLPSGFMFSRSVSDPSDDETYTPLARWNRHAGGGVPYETPDGGLYQESYADTRAYVSVDDSNPSYTSATWIHAPASEGDDGVIGATAAIVLGEMRPAAARGVARSRAVTVDAWTDRAFNLWDDPSADKTLHVEVSAAAAASVATSWTVRDIDGVVVASGDRGDQLAAGTPLGFDVAVPAHDGILFVEVSALAGTEESLVRTTLAVLEPHAYGADDRRLGIANYPWLLEPSEDDVLDLMLAVGIKRVRIAYDGAPGIPVSRLDAAGIDHSVELSGLPIGGTDAEVAAWADEKVAIAIAADAEYFEVSNEVDTPWMSGEKAAEYVSDGLVPVRERLDAAGSSMKVLNAGTGGCDYVWIEGVQDAGGWDLIDGLAIHPGRGNFTADYAPDPSEWDTGSNGEYWNFYGAVRKARQIVDEAGDGKELWFTEAYACTRPNAWWNDTYRHAAENVVLSLALAYAEGVTGVNWYQLHDGIVNHPGLANPDNPEYHYGLMNRDLSAKPSLLALRAAARALDGAAFTRWLSFDDDAVKGLLFSTPTGPLSVLWTRHDGYVLNADHGTGTDYASPEPWVDPWPTKTQLTVTGTDAEVTVVDAIGRETALAGGSEVVLTLDGAPRLVRGLGDAPDEGAHT